MTRAPRRIDIVDPGYYRFRQVPNGPWLAAEITIQDGMIYISEDGKPTTIGVSAAAYADLVVEATMEGRAFTDALLRVLWFGERIERPEYQHILAMRAWAKQHAPRHPAADPSKPINLNTVPIDMII